MERDRKVVAIEFTVIILLWALVVTSPLLFTDDLNRNWRVIHIMWAECVVVGFAFLFNRFLLMPYLFFTKKYTKYTLSLLLLFIFLGIFILYLDGVNIILSLFGHELPDSPMQQVATEVTNQVRHHQVTPPRRPPLFMPPASNMIPPAITVMLLSMIVIALDLGLKIAVKWIISERNQAESERERVSAQLSNLQSQVSPHFFMNTLNNIHALVDIDASRAKRTIIELSTLMDYLLYESSAKESVSLQKEVEFIENYINLMRLRYPKRVLIEFTCGDNMPAVKIPPLLFLNFIENAFKYGVDYDQESYIKISFNFSDTFIEMKTLNSNHSKSVKSDRHGLGISNSCKRLDLLFGDEYSLNISDKDHIYFVNLKIPVL